jgi:hypothetical protein
MSTAHTPQLLARWYRVRGHLATDGGTDSDGGKNVSWHVIPAG